MKIKDDFRVYEETNIKGETVYRIRVGGKRGEAIVATKDESLAQEQARQLNIDPYYFERGDTIADRIESENLRKK